MRIRDLNIGDLRVLEGLQNGFPMPDICNPNYFLQIAIEDDDRLIGACFVKLTTETILIFNKDISKLRKMKAWLKLAQRIENEGTARGLEDTHVFLLGEEKETKSYRNLLLRLGFVDESGIPLCYRARGKQWVKAKDKKREQARIA